jgi:hypothetical protein
MKMAEDKRTGVDRRQFSYSYYFPERRRDGDRRNKDSLISIDMKKE